MTSKEDIIVNSFVFISTVILILIIIYYFCLKPNRDRPIVLPIPPSYAQILNERTPEYQIENEDHKPPDYDDSYFIVTSI